MGVRWIFTQTGDLEKDHRTKQRKEDKLDALTSTKEERFWSSVKQVKHRSERRLKLALPSVRDRKTKNERQYEDVM